MHDTNRTGQIYCCDGGRICGDSLPEQCRGKAYRILDSGGNVIKEVGPPLTLRAKSKLAPKLCARRNWRMQAKEQRRKDQALLDTYATPQDIDLAQQKAETDVNLAIQAAQNKIDDARKRRQKFENEAEFYKKRLCHPKWPKACATSTTRSRRSRNCSTSRRAMPPRSRPSTTPTASATAS
jgi:hypothetical protein